MKYLIHAEGNVTNLQEKNYIVNARTSEEARELAQQEFKEEYNCDEVYIGKAMSKSGQVILAVICMIGAIFLSFIDWKSGHTTVSMKPDLISCAFACSIYFAYVFRFKGLKGFSLLDGLFIILWTLLLSAFIQIMLSSSTFEFKIFGTLINSKLLFLMAAILSWIGLKGISAIVMGVVLILGLARVVLLNDAMGAMWGPVFILCTVMGVVMYCAVEPVILELMPYYRKSVKRQVQLTKNNLTETGRDIAVVGNGMKKGSKMINTAARKYYVSKKNKTDEKRECNKPNSTKKEEVEKKENVESELKESKAD